MEVRGNRWTERKCEGNFDVKNRKGWEAMGGKAREDRRKEREGRGRESEEKQSKKDKTRQNK